MPVSAESDLVLSCMVRFILTYLLGAEKKITPRTQSETQKHHLTVKTNEKRNKYLCYL